MRRLLGSVRMSQFFDVVQKMCIRPFTLIIGSMLMLAASSCDSQKSAGGLAGPLISALEIRYKSGSTVDEERVRNVIRSKPGTELSVEALDADIQALYESGLVEDVDFFSEWDGECVRLIAQVSPRRPFGPPFCSGNAAYSTISLLEISGLVNVQAITKDALKAAAQEIERFYVEEGYPEVVVSVRAFDGSEARPDDYRFVIEEGRKTGHSSAQ